MEIMYIENVTKIYKNGTISIPALQEINLSIEKGTFNAIIGRSGSGKSTLLNIMGGLESPSTGRVMLNDTDLAKLNDSSLAAVRRKKLGFVFQAFYLLPEFTLYENVLIPSFLDEQEIDTDFIEYLLEKLNIQSKKNNYPAQLSGGEQQRAAIARAVSICPDLLLADEPTGNLDNKSGGEVMDLLKSLQKEIGQTTIMVTHDLDLARQADRIIMLEDGKIKDNFTKD
ncbi:ABC transporter ATP-binding protein [Robinsoniella peoriensis]|uniref:ABC transporter ATP-binding protein n=1 Tax=Robinsoniella peoriensis TaxID=180332 RepID=UPI00085BC8B5|nr:ABC transporter ATP-binding protein [Robinsoniella peoriensis]